VSKPAFPKCQGIVPDVPKGVPDVSKLRCKAIVFESIWLTPSQNSFKPIPFLSTDSVFVTVCRQTPQSDSSLRERFGEGTEKKKRKDAGATGPCTP
jgi:hypothetical protein